MQFSLVVDDFGVKYIGEEHVRHLIQALQTDHKEPGDAYEVKVDWKGDLFCGITLEWHYGTGDPHDTEGRYLDISMKKYVPNYKNNMSISSPRNHSTTHFEKNPRNTVPTHKTLWNLIPQTR